MDEASSSGPCLTYNGWRQRLRVLRQTIRQLRPHARGPPASHRGASSNASDTSSSTWSPFSLVRSSSGSGSPSSDATAGASPATPAFASTEALISFVDAEFEGLLLALRLDTRFSASPTARTAEAQTLMHRAAFSHELRRYFREQLRQQRRSAKQASSKAAPSGGLPPSIFTRPREGTWLSSEAKVEAGPLSAEARRRQRAEMAQRQRNCLYAEAQDYLASARLWLDAERERVQAGVTTGDEALAFGVLCVASACGALLQCEVEDEERPVPRSVYEHAARAFQLSHSSSRGGSQSKTARSGGQEARNATSGAGGDAKPCAWAPSLAHLVVGEGNLEGLLRSFPGQPIPPPPPPSRSPSRQPPANTNEKAGTAAPWGSLFIPWDDHPPAAHSRGTHLAHTLLMGLGATLEEDFGCYEMAVNYYELAALVLIEELPPWMWYWESSWDDCDDDEDNNEEEERSGGGELGSNTTTPPSTTTSRVTGAVYVQRRLRDAIFSSGYRARQEEPLGLFARRMQEVQRDGDAQDDDDDNATRYAGSPDTRQPTSFSCAAGAPAPASVSAPSPESREQQRTEAVTAYLQVARDVRLHCQEMLHSYLRAMRSATEAAVVAGDNGRALLYVHNALRTLQTEELRRFDCLALHQHANRSSSDESRHDLSVRDDAQAEGSNRDVAAAEDARQTQQRVQVRLPLVDHRRVWPQGLQEHVAFRRDTVHASLHFHVCRFLLLMVAAADEVGGRGTAATQRAGGARAGEAGASTAEVSGVAPWLLAYADAPVSSLDALHGIAVEMHALEASTVLLPCQGPRGENEAGAGPSRGLCVSAVARIPGVVVGPTRTPCDEPVPSFIASEAYAKVKAKVLSDSRPGATRERAQQSTAELAELSSSSSSEDAGGRDNDSDGGEGDRDASHGGDPPVCSERAAVSSSTAAAPTVERLTAHLANLLTLSQQPVLFDIAAAPTAPHPLVFRSTRAGKQFLQEQLSAVAEALEGIGLGSRAVLMLTQRLRKALLYPPLVAAPLTHTAEAGAREHMC